MSLHNVKKSLERHLSTLVPNIDTAYEGDSYTPVSGTPYQRIQIVPRRVENPVFGSEYYRMIGEFQVFLAYPLNRGTGDVLTQAERVRNHFKRGTSFLENNTRVHILSTPEILSAIVTQDRIVVPVMIEYTAEVNEV